MRETAKGRALVAGAGIGGLAAAAALSPHFAEVIVFEKDRLALTPGPRKGVAQGAHVHALLRGGEESLDGLLPGIRRDFVEAGATVATIGLDYRIFEEGAFRPRRDLGSTILCMTRPGYEQALRNRVRTLNNVRIVEDSRVERIVFADGAATGLAVRIGDGAPEEVAGDLIVDARGRGAALTNELAAAGFDEPPEEVIGIAMSYATARFKKPEAHRGSAEIIACQPSPPDRRYALLFPIENEEWILTLGGRGDIVPPTDLAGFLRFAEGLATPEISERVQHAEHVGSVNAYRKLTSTWRRYDLARRFPQHLIPIGDTISSFNPVYGQGMTVAIRHAVALKAALGAGAADLTHAYFSEAMKASEEAWNFAAPIDLAYPEVTGTRPPDFAMQQALRFGLRWLADDDEAVHRLILDISQMARPSSDLRKASILARAITKAREKGFTSTA